MEESRRTKDYFKVLQIDEVSKKTDPFIRDFLFLFCCQAQPQLNSTQLQLKVRLRSAIFSNKSSHPPGHPATHPSRQVEEVELSVNVNFNSNKG